MELKIEYRSTDELIPYALNSRTHDDIQVSQIAGSIKEFGFTNPVLIDESGTIIAGHGRVMAAKKLNLDSVPTITLSHLSDIQRRAYVIADNKLALNAGWDEEMLRVEIESLLSSGFSVDLLGFSPEDLDGFSKEMERKSGLTEEDSAPPVSTSESICKPGDIWILGSHRLLCGDSTRIDQLEGLCSGRKIDLWLTDPPYNVAYEGGTADKLKILNDSMDNDSFRQFLRDSYVAADAVMRPGACFYIWHADSEGFNFRGAAVDAGWKVRQCLIWKKSSLVLGRQDYQWRHEPCLYGSKRCECDASATYDEQHDPCLYGWKDGAAHLWNSDRKQTTILEFEKPSRNGDHPTMKPVALFEYQLKNSTKPGGAVLDSFAGSGTTIIAAEKSGRQAFAVELDPKYCDVIIKRWQDFTGMSAHLEGTGDMFDALSMMGGQNGKE